MNHPSIRRSLSMFASIAILFALLTCTGLTSAFADEVKLRSVPGTTVTLDANGGQTPQESVTLTDEGTLPSLPTPTREGWVFEGWYTQPVNERVNFDNSRDAAHYWRWEITTQGQAVHEGEPCEATTLYAKYQPTKIEYKMLPQGWKGNTGALRCTREYGVPSSGVVYGWNTTPWAGYAFDGWYDAPIGGNPIITVGEIPDGTTMDELTPGWTPMTGQPLYAHWHKIDDPAVNHESYPYVGYQVPTRVIVSSAQTNITCNKAVSATATVYPAGKTGITHLTWQSSDESVLKVVGDGLKVMLVPQGKEGMVTITASIDHYGIQGTRTVNVGNHNWDRGRTIVWGNCTREYTVKYTCTTCGASEQRQLPADGHRFTHHTTHPTCTEPGCEERLCTVCGLHESEVVQPAAGHTYTTKIVRSCVGTERILTCSTCGDTHSTTESSTAHHRWNSFKTVDKQATCATEGSKSIHCADCEVTKESEVIPVDDHHSWSEWRETLAPTTTTMGEETRSCSECGTTETHTIEKLPPAEELTPSPGEPTPSPGPEAPAPAPNPGPAAPAPKPNPGKPAPGPQDSPGLQPTPESGTPTVPPLNDVSSDDWFASYVTKAAELGIMSGTGDGNFEPHGLFTREQAVQVLYNLFGNEERAVSASKVDVDQSAWYARAVNWALAHQVMVGTSDTTFGIGQSITREQFAVMLTNYLKQAHVLDWKLNPPDLSVLSTYPDHDSIHDYGRQPMAWVIQNGILSGTRDANGTVTLSPQDFSTRAQAATMYVKAIEKEILPTGK